MHKRDYSPQGVEGSLIAKLEGRVLEAHSPSKSIFEDGASSRRTCSVSMRKNASSEYASSIISFSVFFVCTIRQ